jgi:pimeloyl-ACP methyl ester carboxylesterase
MKWSPAIFLLGAIASACHPAKSGHASAEPAIVASVDTANTTPAAPPPPPPPAQVERLLVPGDLVASVVRATDGTPPTTVFVPGLCSNANIYLHTFREAARRRGGVVAIEGDQPCGGGGFHSFTWDAGRLHARVEAALAAAGLTEVPREGLTIIGYSQGAALAEQMAQRWPERYSRVVLIGSPTDPAPRNLARARSVVTMSCDRDVPARMKQAAHAAARAGVPATYVEMPGCHHGNVTEGERVFDETLEWLRMNERAPDPRAASVRIVGTPPTL